MNRKRGILKTAAAAVTAALMFSAMIPAYAAVPIGDNGTTASNDTSLTIQKGITVYNDESMTVDGPTITYSYTIEPATVASGTTVTDAANNTAYVHAGSAGGITLSSSTVAFTGEDIAAVPAGQEVKKTIGLNVDITKFDRPGIYRYKLTDTTSVSALYAAGITRDDDYEKDRFLDVYVSRKEDGTFQVSGYALQKEDTDGTLVKDPGYIADSEKPETGDNLTDNYYTYNITVKKQVTGAMGDRNHEFPFTITIANESKSYYSGKDASALTKSSSTSVSTALKHGEAYYIRGLSPKAVEGIVETNDTEDLYIVTVEGKASPSATGTSIAVTEGTNAQNKSTYTAASSAVSTYDASNGSSSVEAVPESTERAEVTYTNNMNEVSPTGVIMRFGPFLFILAAGIMILVSIRRGRTAEVRF